MLYFKVLPQSVGILYSRGLEELLEETPDTGTSTVDTVHVFYHATTTVQ